MSARPSLAPRSALGRAAPYLALLGSITSLCVGSSFAKGLFPLVGAAGATALRVGFSALILLAIWRPWRASWKRADLLRIVRYGAVMGAMNLCFYLSLRTLPLGLAIAFEFLGPLAVALTHSRRPKHFLMVGLAVIGLALLLPIRGGAGTLDSTGVGFALTAAVFWALYIVFGKRTAHLHAGHTVALGMTTSALIVVPIGAFAAGPKLLAPSLLLMGAAVGLLSSAIPYSLEMVALKRLSPRSFGVLLGAEPVLGALAGAALLGERLAPIQWLAIGLVVLASVMTLSDQADEAPSMVIAADEAELRCSAQPAQSLAK